MHRLLFALLLIGCAGGSGTVGYYGSASATVVAPSPDLVYVSPGVQVIADYDEPVFYTDGYYWRYYGGVWYRSHDWRGGWAYASPPRPLLRIDRPYAYVRYRPRGYVSRRTYRDDRRPVYRDNRPVYRDYRTPDRDGWRTAPRRDVEVRDHRSRPRDDGRYRDRRGDRRRDRR